MYDPMTVIWSNRLFTLWHKDPESDGTDDSCGWPWPKFSEDDKKVIKEMVEWELKFSYYSVRKPTNADCPLNPGLSWIGPSRMSPGECLGMVAAAWMTIAWKRDKRKKLTADEWWTVANLATNPDDNIQGTLAGREMNVSDRVSNFLYCVMRIYLYHHRPWWRHPRWHIRHWRLQIYFIQDLKRWLWSRCEGCGERFPWGYSPISLQWASGGPRWFRGETDKYHHECVPRRK